MPQRVIARLDLAIASQQQPRPGLVLPSKAEAQSSRLVIPY